MRSCRLPSGAEIPVFGIGTWRMGENARRRAQELDAVRYALDLGYPMIDTAEMYGEGAAEEIVGEAIKGRQVRPFIVSKVYPHNAARAGNASNQVLYCLSRRGPEYDLIPWMRKRSIPLMAYSPLDQGALLTKPALKRLAGEVGCTTAQLALAWLLAQPGVVTIPKSSSRERVKENFGALDVRLTPQVLAELDKAFPPPRAKQPLQML